MCYGTTGVLSIIMVVLIIQNITKSSTFHVFHCFFLLNGACVIFRIKSVKLNQNGNINFYN